MSCFNAFNYSVNLIDLLCLQGDIGLRGGGISVFSLFGGTHPDGPSCGLPGVGPTLRSQNERHFSDI